MKIWGIDLSVVIVALVTAYIGYQFNYRSKKRELFLKELSTSYNEIYSPMFEQLSIIVDAEEKRDKLGMIEIFIQEYSGKDSKIRLIASSFILEYFHNLRIVYYKYKKAESRVTEQEVLENIDRFYAMIEKEYWNAHDTIYEDHKQFISNTFNNPVFVVIANISRIVYHLSVFFFWISAVVLYFSIFQVAFPLELMPEWWEFKYAVLLVLVATTFFAIMLMFKEVIIKKNRRESIITKNLKKKIKKVFFVARLRN